MSLQTPLSQKRVQFSTSSSSTRQITSTTGRTNHHHTPQLTQPSPQPLAKLPRLLATPTNTLKSSSQTTTTNSLISSQNSSSSTTSAADSNAITVGIRVRPLCTKERSSGCHECLFLDPDSDNTQIWVTDKSSKKLKFGGDFIISDQTSPNLPVTGNDGIVDPNIIGNNI